MPASAYLRCIFTNIRCRTLHSSQPFPLHPSHFFHLMLQSIGYANLAKLDPQYGLCRCLTSVMFIILYYILYWCIKFQILFLFIAFRHQCCSSSYLCCDGEFKRNSYWTCSCSIIASILPSPQSGRSCCWSWCLQKCCFYRDLICWNLSSCIRYFQVVSSSVL